ncbi:thioredoxin family protein [uncultured Methanoregula sp.]|uniref:thioredoxin family protein n=1 Tax=uncultured Methanoregula sp. TaxID=1005933 RepID=UPI002AAC056A|nr:thioredoxin family protein [uncultured Methanoregula sp.]
MRCSILEEKAAIPPAKDAQQETSRSQEQKKPPAAGPIEADDLTWERTVEKAGKPVAVMFYSPACSFCHQMEPYFRNYAGEYGERVLFIRLNILSSPWTSERLGVRSTPVFMFFCNGKPVREIVGAVYPALLKKGIEEVLLQNRECSGGKNEIDYDITGYG